MKQLYKYITLALISISPYAHGEVLSPDTTSLEAKVHALHEQVVREGRLTTVEQHGLTTLPIGVVDEIEGKQYIIIIHNMELTARGAFFDAYISLEVPFSGTPLAFQVQHIAFSSGGLASSSPMRFALVSEHQVNINRDVKLTLPAGARNYIEWDCDGLKSVNLKGVLQDQSTGKTGTGIALSASDPGKLPTADSDPFRVSFGNSQAQQVAVYPNANKGRFGVKVQLQQSAPTKLEIYNMYGIKVAERQLLGHDSYVTSFDLSDRQSGVYLLRTVTGDEETMVKVLVNK